MELSQKQVTKIVYFSFPREWGFIFDSPGSVFQEYYGPFAEKAFILIHKYKKTRRKYLPTVSESVMSAGVIRKKKKKILPTKGLEENFIRPHSSR